MELTRHKLPCCIPGCSRYCLPRVNETALGPITDTEVIRRAHWMVIPIKFRRIYRRAREDFFADATQLRHARCNRLWRWLRNQAIQRAMGIA